MHPDIWKKEKRTQGTNVRREEKKRREEERERETEAKEEKMSKQAKGEKYMLRKRRTDRSEGKR